MQRYNDSYDPELSPTVFVWQDQSMSLEKQNNSCPLETLLNKAICHSFDQEKESFPPMP